MCFIKLTYSINIAFTLNRAIKDTIPDEMFWIPHIIYEFTTKMERFAPKEDSDILRICQRALIYYDCRLSEGIQ